MVEFAGAGVGEQVSQSFIRQARSLGREGLQRLQRSGLSDQQVAFIRQELARRKAGAKPAPEREVIKKFAEARGPEEEVTVESLQRKGIDPFSPKALRSLSEADIAREALTTSSRATGVAQEVVFLKGGEEVFRDIRQPGGGFERTFVPSLRGLTEQRRQAEVFEKMSEAEKQAEQQRIEKEISIEKERAERARTEIIAQLKQPKTTDPRFLPTPVFEEFEPGRRPTFRQEGTGFGAFFGEVGRNIGVLVTSAFAGGDIGRLRNPFDVFEFVGKQRGEIMVPGKIVGGQALIGTSTGFEQGSVSLFEVQEAEQRRLGVPEVAIGTGPGFQAAAISDEESKKIREQFIPLVETGQLTPEQATKQAQQSFESAFGKRTEGLTGLAAQDLTVRSGKQFADLAPRIAVTAAIIGASAASPTAAVALGALALGGASAAASQAGAQLFTRGQLREGFQTLLTGGLLAIGGGSLIIKGVGPLGKLAEIRLDALLEEEFIIGGREIARLDQGGSVFKVTATRGTGFATQRVDLLLPTFPTGITESEALKFAVAGGRGISTTTVAGGGFTANPAAILKGVEQFTFVAKGFTGTGGRIISPGSQLNVARILPEDISTAVGRVDIVRADRLTGSPFGGISRKGAGADQQFVDIISGKGTSLRISARDLSRTLRVDPTSLGRIELLKDATAVKFPGPDSFTVNLGEADFSALALRGNLPSVSEVVSAPQISTQVFRDLGVGAGAVSSRVAEIVSPTIQAPAASGFLFPTIVGGAGARSAFAGLGDFERTTGTGFGGRNLLKQLDFRIETSVGDLNIIRLQPREAQTLGLGLGLSSKQLSRQLSRSISRLDLGLGQPQVSVQRTGQIQRQRQLQRQVQQQAFAPSVIFQAFAPPTPTLGGFGFIGPIVPLPRPRKTKKAPTKNGKKRRIRQKIAPSLTGIFAFDFGDVAGPLPVSTPRLGILPTRIRTRPRRKRKKK